MQIKYGRKKVFVWVIEVFVIVVRQITCLPEEDEEWLTMRKE